ncbi:MAG: DegT/DnrJ/EryC1/StrS family aminotransferase, partial [Gorillibacterium sp.]|nr:DegT/DnrJ/EryC1/StrS family aminotransferase [Gorillibacterium sp.]
YLQPSYQRFGYEKGLCPNAEYSADRVCSIPIYPNMTEELVGQVTQTVVAFFEGRRG